MRVRSADESKLVGVGDSGIGQCQAIEQCFPGIGAFGFTVQRSGDSVGHDFEICPLVGIG